MDNDPNWKLIDNWLWCDVLKNEGASKPVPTKERKRKNIKTKYIIPPIDSLVPSNGKFLFDLQVKTFCSVAVFQSLKWSYDLKKYKKIMKHLDIIM